MDRQEAICAKQDGEIVGVLLFSRENNILCFLAVDPAYRRQHIAEKMFYFVLPQMNRDKPVTVTTYREGVPEGIAARAFYQKLGFVPGKLTVEFGSEVQEFVLRNYYKLKFSPAIEVAEKQRADSPKRRQRNAKRELQNVGIGTKSQQALAAQHELMKTQRKKVTKEQMNDKRFLKLLEKQASETAQENIT